MSNIYIYIYIYIINIYNCSATDYKFFTILENKNQVEQNRIDESFNDFNLYI